MFFYSPGPALPLKLELMSENTGEFFAPRSPADSKPTPALWYIADGNRPIGPFKMEDLLDGLHTGRVAWIQYAWKEGMPQWQRICDLAEFAPQKTTPPPVPGPAPTRTNAPSSSKSSAVESLKARSNAATQGLPRSSEAAPASPPPALERKWFIHHSNTQFGPFSVDEIHRFIRIGKIHGRIHAWREGMPQWERLEKLSPFEEAIRDARPPQPPAAGALSSDEQPELESKKAPSRPEQRKGPRRALIAKILHANSNEVGTALCRDISIGGMQLLTDRLPGPRGTRIRLNITPMKGTLPPFVAEAVVIRILEDQRGFCVRFEKLQADALRGIETFLEEEET